MGKRIIAQNRGKGTPTYTAPSHKYKAELKHIKTGGETIRGRITRIIHDPARSAPIGEIEISGEKRFILIPEGVSVGDEIAYGPSAEIKIGNTLPLEKIPEGFPVCNIEAR
ncbi:MAG: 50S ribosomal protein L2, partial [Candidatus Syntropharchaeia archaeon]